MGVRLSATSFTAENVQTGIQVPKVPQLAGIEKRLGEYKNEALLSVVCFFDALLLLQPNVKLVIA